MIRLEKIYSAKSTFASFEVGLQTYFTVLDDVDLLNVYIYTIVTVIAFYFIKLMLKKDFFNQMKTEMWNDQNLF